MWLIWTWAPLAGKRDEADTLLTGQYVYTDGFAPIHTCARVRVHPQTHTHTHPHTPTRTKRAGWVSLCSAKRPNAPPGWRRSRFSTTADATSYSPSLRVRRSLQSESSGLHQCHAFLLNGSARLAACCLSLLSLPLWCWIAAVIGWAKPSGCMISHFEFGRFVCLDAACWQRNPPAMRTVWLPPRRGSYKTSCSYKLKQCSGCCVSAKC